MKGFTTNPTLMRRPASPITKPLPEISSKRSPIGSISFEVFADDFAEMERQARRITTWGKNVSVKIPIMNTRRESAIPLVPQAYQRWYCAQRHGDVHAEQVQDVVDAVKDGAPTYVSVFAGRIADSGLDPVPMMANA